MNTGQRIALKTFVIFGLLLLAAPVGGQEEAQKSPIRITSETMRYGHSQKQVRFEGEVHAVRDAFELWSQKLTVFLRGDAANGTEGGGMDMAENQNIDHLLAEGDVKLQEGNRTGYCQTAWFYPDKGLLRMEGEPRLEQGENSIRGSVIKLYINENKSEVIGGDSGRVEALFYSSDDEGFGDADSQD